MHIIAYKERGLLGETLRDADAKIVRMFKGATYGDGNYYLGGNLRHEMQWIVVCPYMVVPI